MRSRNQTGSGKMIIKEVDGFIEIETNNDFERFQFDHSVMTIKLHIDNQCGKLRYSSFNKTLLIETLKALHDVDATLKG